MEGVNKNSKEKKSENEDIALIPQGVNPNNGVSGFDNIAQAWLTIIQCTSLEGWIDITYYSFETFSYYTIFYFVTLIVFVAFFLIQLVTGVVYSAYDYTLDEQKARLLEQKMNKDMRKSEYKVWTCVWCKKLD